MTCHAAVLALLVATAAPAWAAPRLEATLSPTTATVGDPVEVTLTVQLDAGTRPASVRWPVWNDHWGDAAILATEPARSSADGGSISQRVRIAAYRAGRIDLPAATIAVGSPPIALTTPPDLHLEIRSVLPPHAGELAPKPPAAPRPLPVPRAFWWTAGALVAAAIAVFWALRRRPRIIAVAPTLEPLAELEHTLDELAAADPVAGHIGLSLALRRYLGRALVLPGAESSTSELARRLERRRLDRDLVRRAVRLLREVDPIKFANLPTTAAELQERLDQARGLAREIELQLHPPASESAA